MCYTLWWMHTIKIALMYLFYHTVECCHSWCWFTFMYMFASLLFPYSVLPLASSQLQQDVLKRTKELATLVTLSERFSRYAYARPLGPSSRDHLVKTVQDMRCDVFVLCGVCTCLHTSLVYMKGTSNGSRGRSGGRVKRCNMDWLQCEQLSFLLHSNCCYPLLWWTSVLWSHHTCVYELWAHQSVVMLQTYVVFEHKNRSDKH